MKQQTKKITCPVCQHPASGNYCAHCGARLHPEPLNQITLYSEIIADERVKKIIAEETAKEGSGLSAREFWVYVQMILPVRLPLSMIATLSEKAGETFNLGKKNYGVRKFCHPFAPVLLSVLISIARRSLVIKGVKEAENRCLIEATIPSSIWNLEGKLEIIILTEEGKTRVLIEAKIFGQWIDWGITQRLIDGILGDIEPLCASIGERMK